jgi:hypothetical protein
VTHPVHCRPAGLRPHRPSWRHLDAARTLQWKATINIVRFWLSATGSYARWYERPRAENSFRRWMAFEMAIRTILLEIGLKRSKSRQPGVPVGQDGLAG